ncbi:MAG: L-rhamnose isomerase [Candidatus Aminicenantes bacterium]
MVKRDRILEAYTEARDRYAALGVDTEKALGKLKSIPISLPCWQGDDLTGFEKPDASLEGGGIQITGNYPGKARNIDELRLDLEQAFALIPGCHRLNLHSIYGDFEGQNVDRNAIEADLFSSWVDWAKTNNLKLDFNATCFSHPLAESGFTLSHRDSAIREFWIEHVQRCRRISAFFGKELGASSVHNLWIPDGSKDDPVDRWTHRFQLRESLDTIYAEKYSNDFMKDAVESKLFGLGSEAYVVGSHEFYLAYALKKGLMVCLDLGHFHPTESVADKISSILQFSKEILLHVSRGVRWDSDHVVILNDDLLQIGQEIVRGNALNRVSVALDFFDASINRVGAWVIGTRATLKSFLLALLEPKDLLRRLEDKEDYFSRLAMVEELKAMPHGAVWNHYCQENNVPLAEEWMDSIKEYEIQVLSRRG